MPCIFVEVQGPRPGLGELGNEVQRKQSCIYMGTDKPTPVWKSFFIRVFVITAAILIGAGAVCWFAELRTLVDYGAALIYSGIGAIVIGGIPMLWESTPHQKALFHLSQSSDVSPPDHRLLEGMKYERATDSIMYLMVTVGIISLSFGLLLAEVLA